MFNLDFMDVTVLVKKAAIFMGFLKQLLEVFIFIELNKPAVPVRN